MTIITLGALVTSFSSLFMTDTMPAWAKQAVVLTFAIVLTLGYTATHEGLALSGLFDSLINGLTAGLTALGVYHLTAGDSQG
jgi:multisubunit Na+/H+ antiporter MnhB subunit